MANVDAPFGLRPSSKIDGSDLDYGLQTVSIPDTDANDYFINQPVALAGSSVGNYPTVARITSATDQPMDFVIVGFEPDFANESFLTIYGLASTNRVARVMPIKDVVFEIQADGAIAATDVGNNAFITLEVGNTVSGNSTVELSSASIAATATHNLKIMGISEDPNNQDLTVNNPNVYVIVNRSNLAIGSLGV